MEQFPAELLLHVFQFVDCPQALLVVAQVCRTWNEIVNDNDGDLWKSMQFVLVESFSCLCLGRFMIKFGSLTPLDADARKVISLATVPTNVICG